MPALKRKQKRSFVAPFSQLKRSKSTRDIPATTKRQSRVTHMQSPLRLTNVQNITPGTRRKVKERFVRALASQNNNNVAKGKSPGFIIPVDFSESQASCSQQHLGTESQHDDCLTDLLHVKADSQALDEPSRERISDKKTSRNGNVNDMLNRSDSILIGDDFYSGTSTFISRNAKVSVPIVNATGDNETKGEHTDDRVAKAEVGSESGEEFDLRLSQNDYTEGKSRTTGPTCVEKSKSYNSNTHSGGTGAPAGINVLDVRERESNQEGATENIDIMTEHRKGSLELKDKKGGPVAIPRFINKCSETNMKQTPVKIMKVAVPLRKQSSSINMKHDTVEVRKKPGHSKKPSSRVKQNVTLSKMAPTETTCQENSGGAHGHVRDHETIREPPVGHIVKKRTKNTDKSKRKSHSKFSYEARKHAVLKAVYKMHLEILELQHRRTRISLQTGCDQTQLVRLDASQNVRVHCLP